MQPWELIGPGAHEIPLKADTTIDLPDDAIRAMLIALPCEHLHHDQPDWHDHDEPCPLKARLLREGTRGNE